MPHLPSQLSTASLLTVALLGACRATRPAAPSAGVEPVTAVGSAPTTAAVPAAGRAARPSFTPADARFMQHMLMHHAQALTMTALVPARTRRDDLRLLAERIAVSQQDETALMRRWLTARGQPLAPAGHDAHQAAHHPAGHPTPGAPAAMPMMPGMLTAGELAELTAATGAAFDARFLRFMIRHHEGALTMVAGLLATPGAAQESELFGFASDVDADQRAEIARMRALARALPNELPNDP